MPIVVRAQTYVQPREHAFRNAAAPPQKAVRHAAKRFGANYLDSIRHSSTPPVGNAAGIAQSGAVTASALKSTPISSGEVSRLTSSSMESRSEERRVGEEWVSTCRYRWSRYH